MSELTNAAMSANVFAYQYDNIGNRVSASRNATNAVYTAITNQSFPSLTSLLSFDSDGNLATNSYCWGRDISGSLQGAGGIGGLLATVRSGDPELVEGLYTFDANGNVGQLLVSSNPPNIAACASDQIMASEES